MLMTHYNIIILESNLNTETWFKTFTGEAFEAAVLDSCANTYVSWKTWIICYTKCLSSAEKKQS